MKLWLCSWPWDFSMSGDMENQLHTADERSGMPRGFASAKRPAGVPVKRFFARFSSLSDVPSADLEFLAERLRLAMDLGQGSQTAALYAAVRDEIRRRESARNG
jgi:hypothetical protein